MSMREIADIRAPEEIVEAFEVLSAKAGEIGFPIAFDTSGQPLSLYFHEDYDFVLVDKFKLRICFPTKNVQTAKATGIICRIDDLGRVVIPKEIRREQGIREGDPLEIFSSDEGVIFKKYLPGTESAKQHIDILRDVIREDMNASREVREMLLKQVNELEAGIKAAEK